MELVGTGRTADVYALDGGRAMTALILVQVALAVPELTVAIPVAVELLAC
ncbi:MULTISPECIES: hypothetical protein [unclassified Kitasatospora]|nr:MULTISPECIES: hypothetical protein [unclassified Kitasatospora]